MAVFLVKHLNSLKSFMQFGLSFSNIFPIYLVKNSFANKINKTILILQIINNSPMRGLYEKLGLGL